VDRAQFNNTFRAAHGGGQHGTIGEMFMYYLSTKKQLHVLNLLIEGNSISSTARFTDVHRDTCTRLMRRFGQACQNFLNRELRDLEFSHLEIDEIWTFCRKKQRHLTGEEPDVKDIGDIYLYVALDEATRLIPAFRVDKRTEEATVAFMMDLASRLKVPKRPSSERLNPIVRISTDAFPAYPAAIELAFGPLAEYAQIVKKVVNKELKIDKRIITGKIDASDVSTSLVERNNLTTRTFMRRFMRKSLGFSKKLENLRLAVAIYIAYYDYCWPHKTLKNTAAMRAGLIGERWRLDDLYLHLRDRWPDLFLVTEREKAMMA
jgi:IS1 family transposase